MATVEAGAAGEKGLRGGTLGFLSGVVIGVASTAPGYSLAASLGLVTASVGLQSPAVMLLAFVPMLFIAASYYYMNRADPDCGTTFSWVTRAMGPRLGWIGGWGILAADILVMPSLSQITGAYFYSLIGVDNPSRGAVLMVGVIFIVLMTLICYVGIEASARLQYVLLAAELVILVIFSIVALYKVGTQDIKGSLTPTLSWLNPFSVSASSLSAGIITTIFIYWGWDSTVTVNEESTDATEGPGRAAIISTFVLVAIYVIVSIAAQAFHGADFLTKHSDDVLGALGKDVLGSPWDKLLIIAVLTSAAASTQTTILPTTRTALSMATKGAAPAYFARVHPRFLTPSTSTIWFGIISIIWYVALTYLSENILADSITALGLMIAFYYGITGFACTIFYRRELTKSAKNFVMMGVAPVLGGLMLTYALVRSAIDYADPANSSSGAWFGLGVPFVLGIGTLAIGFVFMFAWQFASGSPFFRRRPEVFVDPAATTPDGVV